jgi:CheY-like chemotaxis protein
LLAIKCVVADPPTAGPAYVATLAPDLVVLDLLIDHADPGWPFLERLEADPVTAAIPILVCAGDVAVLVRVVDRLPAWTCGALRNPFALDEFLAAVRICRGEAPRPEPD